MFIAEKVSPKYNIHVEYVNILDGLGEDMDNILLNLSKQSGFKNRM